MSRPEFQTTIYDPEFLNFKRPRWSLNCIENRALLCVERWRVALTQCKQGCLTSKTRLLEEESLQEGKSAGNIMEYLKELLARDHRPGYGGLALAFLVAMVLVSLLLKSQQP
jgi:hypothetical protein